MHYFLSKANLIISKIFPDLFYPFNWPFFPPTLQFYFKLKYSCCASQVAEWWRILLKQETQETQVQSLNWEDPLEKEMATHSSILAWRIPWTEEPGGLQSMGSQRVTQLSMNAHSYCIILYILQVYRIVIHNFWRLYSIYSYYKILAIFPMLWNIS